MSDNRGSSSVEWANLEHTEGIKKADKNRIMSYYIRVSFDASGLFRFYEIEIM